MNFNINDLNDMIKNQLSLNRNDFSDDINLKDLGLDSLDMVEILLTLEEQYSIFVHEEDIKDVITLKDLKNIILCKQYEIKN